jgi:putative ABC transport system permease protein
MLWLLAGNLRRRWLEYCLVAVAVGVVVAAVLVQRAIAASTQSAVHELAHRLGKNMLVVPASTDMAGFWRGEYGTASLVDSSARTLTSSHLAPHLRAVESRLYGRIRLNDVDVDLVGVDQGWPALGDVAPAVLGRGPAARLGVSTGQLLDLHGVPVFVAGVMESSPDEPENAVLVPLGAAQHILARPGAISALRLGGCWCSLDVAALGKEVERLLPGTRAITVAGMLAAQQGSVAVTNRYAALLQIAAGLIVAALAAAIVGSQARRRNRELALFAAIGSNPAWVATLFTVEAACAGAVGAVMGHVFAQAAATWLGERIVGAPLTVGWELLVPAIVITSGIAAVAAAIPASRAAARDVTAVLREA